MRRALGGLLLAVVVLVVPAHGTAWCWLHFTWSGYSSIPVYLHPSLGSTIWHEDGTAWTTTELENELRWTLQAIHETSSANLPRMYYAGVRSACSSNATCRIAGAIVIMPDLDDPTACKTGVPTPWNPATGFLVTMMRSDVCPVGSYGNRYEHFESPAQATTWVLGGSWVHELGHTLGLDHYCSTCASRYSACSAMGATPPADLNGAENCLEYYYDDASGLRWMYGAESHPTWNHQEAADGATWSAAPSYTTPALTARFALSSSPGDRMFAVYPSPSGTMQRSMWNWSTGYWQAWGTTTPLRVTRGAVGAAYDAPSGVAYDAYLYGETSTWGEKFWAVTRHTSSAASTEYFWAPSGQGTITHGVSAAFDPYSGFVVLVWRQDNQQITLQYFRPSTGTFDAAIPLWVSGLPVLAFGSPTVACGDSAITRNCVLAWADAAAAGSGQHSHTLRWRHFRVPAGGGTPTWGPLGSLGFIMHNPPVISYKGPATAAGAYVLSWMTESTGGAQHSWTMMKDAGEASGWGSIREHAGGTPRVFGSVGSAAGYSEYTSVR